jgi:hypothetical protein
VGNNGETLVADSSTSTGLRYTAGNPIPNPVLNSCQDIWQRGTSLAITSSSSAFYGPDRWQVYRGATGSTVSRQATGDTTNLPNIQYCARVQRDSGNTSTANINFIQNFESVNSIPFAGKTVTMSFYARAGANYSATSNLLNVYLRSGTGTDQNFVVAYTGVANVVDNQTPTLTTTWQRFTFSGTVPATATELAIQIQSNPTGTAGANDYFEITGVQIDLGSVALPVRRNGATIQGELSAAQRYYVSWNRDGLVSDGGIGNGFTSSGTSQRFYLPLPVVMRTTPTVLDYSTLQVNYITGAVNVSALAFTAAVNNRNTVAVTATASTGLAALVPVFLNVSSTGYLGIGAEL